MTADLLRWVFLEKLTFQLDKKFVAFCGTRNFITVLTKACLWILTWTKLIDNVISLRHILILSCFLRLGPSGSHFPPCFSTKNRPAVLITSVHAECRTLSAQCPAVTLYTIFWTPNSSTFCPHSIFLCLCGSENKQRLFPYTALTEWFLNRDLTLCRPVVTICTTSLTFNNSTFCPHSVFICFVWIWKRTAIIPYTALTDWFCDRGWTLCSPLVTICTLRRTKIHRSEIF